jgi:hypothetical protein
MQSYHNALGASGRPESSFGADRLGRATQCRLPQSGHSLIASNVRLVPKRHSQLSETGSFAAVSEIQFALPITQRLLLLSSSCASRADPMRRGRWRRAVAGRGVAGVVMGVRRKASLTPIVLSITHYLAGIIDSVGNLKARTQRGFEQVAC